MHSPNRHSTSTQLLRNHFATIIPRPNHDSTILRVESKNDSDTTITQPQPNDAGDDEIGVSLAAKSKDPQKISLARLKYLTTQGSRA